MSGRPTAEIVADLRNESVVHMLSILRREAADRLQLLQQKLDEALASKTELDAECQQRRDDNRTINRNWLEVWGKQNVIDALRPPCPTCGGKGNVWDTTTPIEDFAPCPDCVDGKASIQWMADLFNAVFDRSESRFYDNEILDELRRIR